MRISDWSSDVCSSDLLFLDVLFNGCNPQNGDMGIAAQMAFAELLQLCRPDAGVHDCTPATASAFACARSSPMTSRLLVPILRAFGNWQAFSRRWRVDREMPK